MSVLTRPDFVTTFRHECLNACFRRRFVEISAGGEPFARSAVSADDPRPETGFGCRPLTLLTPPWLWPLAIAVSPRTKTARRLERAASSVVVSQLELQAERLR
jgi:hypothetical protein